MKQVKAEGKFEMFIIPNEVSKLSSFTFQKYAQKNAEVNSIDPNEETKFVQVWITKLASEGADDDVDNVTAHGINVGSDHVEHASEYIPVSLFEGLREGDTLKGLHIYGWSFYPKKEEFDLELPEVTLAQSKYRYRRFGNGKFDELLNELVKFSA